MGRLLSQIDVDTLQSQIQQNGGRVQLNSSLRIGGILSASIPWIFMIAGMLLLIYLVVGGIQMMLSGGDPDKFKSAKSHIANALVGFIIIFVSFWVVQLLGNIFGLKGILNVFK